MKTIKIGGLDRPILFGYNALCDFEDTTGKDIINGGLSTVSLRDLRALLFIGLKTGAKRDDKKFEYSLEDVGDWIGGLEDMEKTFEVAMESLSDSLPKKKAQGTGAKKP